MRRRASCTVSVFFAFALVAAACGDDDDGGVSAETTTPAAEDDTTAEDSPQEGPVTIANELDFEFRPVTGTFEVMEGADILGCSGGTFVDAGRPTDGVQRTYTCDSGSNEGSFTADFNFVAVPNEVSDNGTWTVLEGSDDFVGLQGDGDWSIVYDTDDPNVGVGSWTGDISYTS